MNRIFLGSICLLLVFGCANIAPKSDAPDDTEVMLIKGIANYEGTELSLELYMDQEGRFLTKIGGWANQITCYDGEQIWRMENGVGPYEIDFSEKEFMKMVHWPLIENWQGKKGIKILKDTLRLDDGLLKFSLDYENGSLNKLKAINSPYQESISFIGSLEQNSIKVPKEILIQTGFPLASYTFLSIEKVVKPLDWYKRPTYRANGVSFDDQISPELKVRRANTGHIFIKPLIQGKDVGWFLFDSGAGMSLINEDIAKAFDFPVVGEMAMTGIGGATDKQDIVRAKNIKLGPLLMEQINFGTFPAGPGKASRILGEPVMGVLGWDVLLRSVMEIDMLKGKISVYNPSVYNLEEQYSERLFLHWNVPYVQCKFEGGENGLFLIDTGAGDKGPIFHSMAVNRLDLLEGRKTEKGQVKGAGGEVEVKIGKLEWFEIAGHRTNNVTTIFMQGNDGEADLYTEGFLGGQVIQPFKIVFDYPGMKVGFIPR